MKRKFLFYICALIFLFSCEERVEKIKVEVPVLYGSDILNETSVFLYQQNYGNKHKDLADSYFKKGKETISSNSKKAIYYIKRAITLFPDQQYYSALAEFYTLLDLHEEASRVYFFLLHAGHKNKKGENEKIFGTPSEDMLLKYFRSNWLSSHTIDLETVFYIQSIDGIDIQHIRSELLKDPIIGIKEGGKDYQRVLMAFKTSEEMTEFRKSPDSFVSLTSLIADSSAVFELNTANIALFNYRESYYDGYGPFEMLPSEAPGLFVYFTKEMMEGNWVAFNANHISRSVADSVWAIVYAVDTSEMGCPRDFRHIYHRLVTYTPTGKIIDDKVIAWQSGEELTTARFAGNEFALKPHRRKWQSAYSKKDFTNELLLVEPAGDEVKYKIDGKGYIQEVSGQ